MKKLLVALLCIVISACQGADPDLLENQNPNQVSYNLKNDNKPKNFGLINKRSPVLEQDSDLDLTLPLSEMEKVIQKAAIDSGWVTKVLSPGKIRAEIQRQSHKVAVNIFYTPKKLRIVYFSSVDMDYDESTDTIHRNYNRWTARLNKKISTDLYNRELKI